MLVPVLKSKGSIRMTIREIRELSGLSRAEFSRLYNIPKRTLEDWDAGIRKPPIYVVELLERVVRLDFKNKK